MVRDRALLASRIADLIALTGVSAYRVSTDLGIDRSNLYAFLKGDLSRLGLETAICALEYLEDAPKEAPGSAEKRKAAR